MKAFVGLLSVFVVHQCLFQTCTATLLDHVKRTVLGSSSSSVKYPGIKPRVRREWRTLTPEMKERVASAFWYLKNTSTAEGRELYGEHFNNYDEILYLHSCSTTAPKCDQGHYGPHFMLFHRSMLRKMENALWAVDSYYNKDSTQRFAMPYWDISKDSINGEYRNSPDKYIFTDNYFGDFTGDPNQDYAVTGGLFAFWPVSHWTSDKFGRTSRLAKEGVKCAQEEWFQGTTSSDGTTYLRNHDSSSPWTARNPADPNGYGELDGSYELTYTPQDFEACTSKSFAIGSSWMDWQNCIEVSSLDCVKKFTATDVNAYMKNLTDQVQEALQNGDTESALRTTNSAIAPLKSEDSGSSSMNCTSVNPVGFYEEGNTRKYPRVLHSIAHMKLGEDLLDVTTSPNDVIFTGYHAYIDMSNMIWMSRVSDDVKSQQYGYPKDSNDKRFLGAAPYGTSGPYSLYDLYACGNNSQFNEYQPFESMWLDGTTLNDVVNYGFAFSNLFDCESLGEDHPDYTRCVNGSGDGGYTHADILYFTSPERTTYTYDTLAHLYYESEADWQ